MRRQMQSGRTEGGRGRRMKNNSGVGNQGNCTCLNCGTTINHSRGVPCQQTKCPNCGNLMTRGNSQQTEVSINNKVNASEFPQIDANICKACGICVEKCPTQAIEIKAGKAQIQTDLCKNCRVCVSVCPQGAIS